MKSWSSVGAPFHESDRSRWSRALCCVCVCEFGKGGGVGGVEIIGLVGRDVVFPRHQRHSCDILAVRRASLKTVSRSYQRRLHECISVLVCASISS